MANGLNGAAAAAQNVANLAGTIYSADKAGDAADANIAATERINALKLKFQQRMWEQTNAYNTPRMQMKRFLKAGLNPNLIYGRGESGNAGMQSVPDLDVGDYGGRARAQSMSMQKYLGFAASSAQTAYTRERKKQVEQETANKAIDATLKTIQASSDKISLKQKQELYDTTVETAKKNLARINQDLDLSRRKDSRQERIVNQTVRKIGQEVRNLRKKGTILSEEAIMKRIDRQMYQQYGLKPTDPFYLRAVNEVLGRIGKGFGFDFGK